MDSAVCRSGMGDGSLCRGRALNAPGSGCDAMVRLRCRSAASSWGFAHSSLPLSRLANEFLYLSRILDPRNCAVTLDARGGDIFWASFLTIHLDR